MLQLDISYTWHGILQQATIGKATSEALTVIKQASSLKIHIVIHIVSSKSMSSVFSADGGACLPVKPWATSPLNPLIAGFDVLTRVHFLLLFFPSFFFLWVWGRDYLAHITVCTSALSLIWHQVRPPVCESRQPWPHGHVTPLILIQTGMAFSHWWPVLRPLMFPSPSFSPYLFYFFPLPTHIIFLPFI